MLIVFAQLLETRQTRQINAKLLPRFGLQALWQFLIRYELMRLIQRHARKRAPELHLNPFRTYGVNASGDFFRMRVQNFDRDLGSFDRRTSVTPLVFPVANCA